MSNWYDHYHEAWYDNLQGNWELPGAGKRSTITMRHILHLLDDSRLKRLSLRDIAWKGKHFFPYQCGEECFCCGGQRYTTADTSYPGIVLHNAPNPYANDYRMIDGKHRMMKLLLSGVTSSLFYVIEYDEVKDYVRRLDI